MKIDILQKVEGEVYLRYHFKDGAIEHTDIEFIHYRGIEEILRGKPLFDALAITPRVCGICGHAHLIATARAIESIVEFEISQKAKAIRSITLYCERIQNHLKWLYLVIVPMLSQMGFTSIAPFEVLRASATIQKVIALFGGQYPHTSYALPGGVVCDPTRLELLQAKAFVEEVYSFYTDTILEPVESFKEFAKSQNLLKAIYDFLKEHNLLRIAQGGDRFLHLEANKKFIATKSRSASSRYVELQPSPLGFAKNALYKGRFFEVGPLARLMDRGFIKDLHRRYKDGLFTRIAARVYETGLLFESIFDHLKRLSLAEPSYREFPKRISGYGEGIVEAPRGSLIHRVWVEEGIIERFEIITPTQFNLANGTKEHPSPAQRAIRGLKSRELAQLVFRSFDICSVCTTH